MKVPLGPVFLFPIGMTGHTSVPQLRHSAMQGPRDSSRDLTLADDGPRPRQELVRIKRRRGEVSRDEIIVTTAPPRPDPKRMRMDQMLLQMSGFCMSATTTAAGPSGRAPEPQKRQRFRRVQTVNMLAFQNKTAVEVEQMVADWATSLETLAAPALGPQQQEVAAVPAGAEVLVGAPDHERAAETAAATAAAVVGPRVAEAGPTAAAAPPAQEAAAAAPSPAAVAAPPAAAQPATAPPAHRPAAKTPPPGHGSAQGMKEALRDAAKQRSSTARYMQVRSRRAGAQRPAQQQQDAERAALESAFHMYDLVCTDVDEAAAGERAERKRQARERAQKAAAEGAILMNYLPMVQQYLQEQGQDAALLAETAAATTGGDVPMADAAPEQQGKAEGSCMQLDVELEGQEDSDEFVYDVYVPVGATSSGGAADADSSGVGLHGMEDDDADVPVVEVEDEDDLFLEEEASEHDSEDSNAESYYANSYPDEDEEASDGDEDEEGWCHVQQRHGGHGAYGGAAATAGERWDDEEYDLTKDEDEEGISGPGAGSRGGRHDVLERLKRRAAKVAAAAGAGLGRRGSKDVGEWGHRLR